MWPIKVSATLRWNAQICPFQNKREVIPLFPIHYKVYRPNVNICDHFICRPIRFQVEKDGDYWICMCRQTKHRPFCDGTHKEPHIQEKNVRFF